MKNCVQGAVFFNVIIMDYLVGISFFALVYGIVFLSIRKKERMALLEYGRDASVFANTKTRNATLKWGLLLIGIGAGLLLANIIIDLDLMDDEAAYFSMSFLLGGVGLVISYFIDLSEDKRNKGEEDK